MTDTIEAVARAHKLLGKLSRSDFDDVLALLESERARAIASHTKALIEGAKLDGVRAGIDAAAGAVHHSAYAVGRIKLLDAETIARRDTALSELIAGDADLIVPDTLADSDGDDGA